MFKLKQQIMDLKATYLLSAMLFWSSLSWPLNDNAQFIRYFLIWNVKIGVVSKNNM